jgi:glycosyltransferase involved in cell wall biosynthesis
MSRLGSPLNRREHTAAEARRDGAPPPLHPASALPRPHICFVAPNLWPAFSHDPDNELIGGADVQQSILARALVRDGYRVSMICLDFGQPQRVLLDGVMVHKAYRPDAGLRVLRFIHPRITTLWRAMRAVDADVYYQRCSAMLTALVAVYCRSYGKRSIFASACDLDFVPGRQPIGYLRDRWLFEQGLKRVDRIVVQNVTQQQACRANYHRESTLIPGCYELPAGASPGAGDCVLWVASMRERDYKRPELFLELARRLPQRRFVMIGGAGGEGSNSACFERIRNEAAAIPNVEFTGFLPLARAEPYFDRARVLVNTSLHEGVPNTFLQAWARGVPTVAFVDTGARLRGEPLYRVVERVEEAAAEIERLFTDEGHWRRASVRCREYFSNTHSTSKVLACFEGLLGELVRDRKALTVHPDHGGRAGTTQ